MRTAHKAKSKAKTRTKSKSLAKFAQLRERNEKGQFVKIDPHYHWTGDKAEVNIDLGKVEIESQVTDEKTGKTTTVLRQISDSKPGIFQRIKSLFNR